MHTDKNDYVVGDTIWFKSYLVDALTQLPVIRSGLSYVELINEKKESLQRFALYNNVGTSFGNINLDTSYASGRYMLRAYTNWMRNFGDSLFFQKEINIVGTGARKWVVSSGAPIFNTTSTGGDVSISFSFKNRNLESLQNREIKVFVTNKDNKILQDGKLQTDYNGQLTARFQLSKQQMIEPVYVQVGNSLKDIAAKKLLFSGQNTDLQLMPESGYLVEGLENTIGLKALSADGFGQDVTGIVKDNNGNKVVEFTSIYKGMGSFSLTPQPTKTYTAVLQNGQEFPLPAAIKEGTIIQVKDAGDKIDIAIKATPTLIGKPFIFTANTRGYNVYQKTITLKAEGNILSFPKNAFPTGVCQAGLQNEKGQLLNQRSFFVNNNDALKIELQTPATSYHSRDSVPLTIKVTNAEGQPVSGNFSLAVTDDDLVKKDNTKDQNILSYLLFQSDIKGYIETPGYYFYNNDADDKAKEEKQKAIDALMLTQAFVRYDLDTTKFKYEAEREFAVKGKVTNGLNKGISTNLILYASGKRTNFIRDTISSDKGLFTFTNLPAFDTSTFVVQARRNSGTKMGLGVEIYKNELPDAKNTVWSQQQYNNIGIDSLLLKSAEQKQAYNQAYLKQNGYLPEVIVTANKGIPGSANLNGPGKADQIIGADEIKPMMQKNLYDILKEKVKGFGTTPIKYGSFYSPGLSVNNNYALFIIDGQPMEFYLPPVAQTAQGPSYDDVDFFKQGFDGIPNPNYNPTYGPIGRRIDHLKQFEGSDIKGIEVLNSLLFKEKYHKKYNNGSSVYANSLVTLAYVEITTYSGGGPGKKMIPGMAYLFPTPFHYGKAFYTPAYDATDTNVLPDHRSTVYWNPYVITNEKGEALVNFNATDLPSGKKQTTYTIWIEGIDLEGNISMKTKQIEIKNNTAEIAPITL